MDKKILILANHAGGLYKFRNELIDQLVKKYEVHISVPNIQFLAEKVSKNTILHNIEINRRNKNPIYELKLLVDYYRQITSIRPDLILTYTIKPNIYGTFIARIKKIPTINTITGLGTAFENKGSTLYRMIVCLYRFAFKKTNLVYFQNRYSQELFINEKIIDKEKTKLVCGSGVNLSVHKPVEEEELSFLFIGRLMREKGIEEFFYVAERISEEKPFIKFKVMGMCEEEKYLEQIKNIHCMEYLGEMDDPRCEMGKAMCIVLPSYHEGMSNTLLEGAAMAKPLIASNIPGCREIIDDGINGFLCEKKDKQSLYLAIKHMLELTKEERIQMGNQGRKKVEILFDREKIVNDYTTTISKILANE